MKRFAFVFAAVAVIAAQPAGAAVVGHSVAAEGLSAQRIATILPAQEQTAWREYLTRSQAQRAADKAALAAELKPGEMRPAAPPEGHGDTMPLNHYPEWYQSPEARHIADVIVSFQTPAGGWGKNQRRDGPLRTPGQPYVADNISKYLGTDDFDAPAEPAWNYVGTLDNNATTTELRFLGLVAGQVRGANGDVYRASFLRGITYLLNAQYPNGGWPQVWPLEGGYHDAITYNDDAVALSAQLLSDLAAGHYPFVPQEMRERAGKAAARAVDCILDTQVKIDGKRTLWGQQHDPLTLQPVAARNFEPAELSSEESADLLVYLMSRPNPTPAEIEAIDGGVAWLKKAALHDVAWTRTAVGRGLVPSPGAPAIWARYYSIATGKPVFGDRDKSVHDDVSELTAERRNGYAWYNTAPRKALSAYAKWKTR